MRTATFIVAAVTTFAMSGVPYGTASAAVTRLLGVYEEAAEGNCADPTTGCFVYFATLGQPLKITKVSCNIVVNSGASFTGVQLGQASGNKNKFLDGQYLNPIGTLIYSGPFTQYQILVDTLHVIPGSWRPAIQIGFNQSTGSSVRCTISGSET